MARNAARIFKAQLEAGGQALGWTIARVPFDAAKAWKPMVLIAAVRRRPKARQGWEKMTATQRRSELMAIFYYQTPPAIQKRVDKLCDAAEKRA